VPGEVPLERPDDDGLEVPGGPPRVGVHLEPEVGRQGTFNGMTAWAGDTRRACLPPPPRPWHWSLLALPTPHPEVLASNHRAGRLDPPRAARQAFDLSTK
jgi:hypothetical protein